MTVPDSSDDLAGARGPSEGLWVVIGLSQEAVDGGLEFDDGWEHAVLEAPPR